VTVRRPTPWGIVAIAAGAAGLLAATGLLPVPLQAVSVALVVLAGPGSVLRIWVPMPGSTAAVLVPAFGIATLILLTTAMETLGHWLPSASLLALSAASVIGGLSRRRVAPGPDSSAGTQGSSRTRRSGHRTSPTRVEEVT
jgi:hypothetical protein